VDVHQRHHVVGIAAVCLSGLFAISIAASQDKLPGAIILDQSCSRKPSFGPGDPKPTLGCKSDVDKGDSLLRGGREINGLVHFRIGYDSKVDDLQKQAFKLAIRMWNKHRETTKFVFEDTSTGTPDFRLVEGAPQPELERDECAGYMSEGSYIWYSTLNMSWVTRETHLEAAARVYAHELGHALNICHKSASPLMRAGELNEPCEVRAAIVLPDIPEDDVRDAWICGLGARTEARRLDELKKLKPQKAPKPF
jgi:hypothetical protein